tara:strand:- start:48 stop:152 length:105 start_codon:yes stop_codon:yes gene_type:complete
MALGIILSFGAIATATWTPEVVTAWQEMVDAQSL